MRLLYNSRRTRPSWILSLILLTWVITNFSNSLFEFEQNFVCLFGQLKLVDTPFSAVHAGVTAQVTAHHAGVTTGVNMFSCCAEQLTRTGRHQAVRPAVRVKPQVNAGKCFPWDSFCIATRQICFNLHLVTWPAWPP
jgi:hypothetical protein